VSAPSSISPGHPTPEPVVQSGGELLVHGALVVGYAQACVNLHIVAGRRAAELVHDLDVTRWYPLSRWRELERVVVQAYQRSDAIMVKVGMEMMAGWYQFGPGKDLIRSGADFLQFQTGSNGFTSVVRGPPELVGAFEIRSFDPAAGRAVVHSTTPFSRKMECGVLMGGILAPGDVEYVDVKNEADPDLLEVEFH
jgi:hypothetical protein